MSIKQKIFTILRADKRLWDKDKNEFELNQTLLFDLVEKLDERVIELLFSNETTKKKFFKPIKDVYIFDERSFRFFLEENRVNNSYTIYKNRIGLSDGKKFLKDSADVVLDFPYKDCVLEGGQSNEEGFDTYFEYDEKVSATEEKKGLKPQTYNQKQAKRKEIFFNQTLAQDEIDRLFDKKAFVNWKRFTCKGKEKVKELKRDENGTIRENLIIKGNNLLALHSLKSEFAGKVKLIYIDPPYNTGNDGFKYNDKFNHSTWLTFMKNRLEIARDLLSDDGVIFVQIDTSRNNAIGSPEFAYLGILLDEIFKRKNFIANLHWKKKKQPSFLSRVAGVMESILVYSKDESLVEKLAFENTTDTTTRVDNISNNNSTRKITKGISYKGKKDFIIKKGAYKNKTMITEFLEDVYIENGIVKNNFQVKARFRNTQDEIYRFCSEKLLYITENNSFRRLKSKEELKKKKAITDLLLDWGDNQDATQELRDLFEMNSDEKAFDNPKPEQLISNIIKSVTKPKDIVLDFHLGSGTTAAVAHKMGRRYIGIEQMDYINEITCKRVQKVIEGEQGGISKSVNWQGGGDFVYFELARWNEKAKEKILVSKNFKELKTFFNEMYEKYFLNYNLMQKDFIENTINEDEFQALSLEEQKKIFISMLDNNQMYINFSEIRDKKFGVSDEDIKMSEEFYKKDK